MTESEMGCPICGEPLKFNTKFRYYLKTCGNKMCQKRQNYEATKKSIQEKYGVDNISQLDEIKIQKKRIFQSKYGTEYITQSEYFKNKSKQTCQERYGVDNPLKCEEIKEKAKQTCQERYGVDNPLKCEEIKEKAKQTCQEKYNSNSPLESLTIRGKIKQTLIEKYGVDNPLKCEEIKEKVKQTCQERYGVNWACERPENREKNYLYKLYTLPSNQIVSIQGYENLFLDDYFKNGGDEKNILINNKDIEEKIGKIEYIDVIGKKHRYYPDFYLIKENKIIEVKSTWTMIIEEELNYLKRQACLDVGLDFEFKIYNNNYDRK